MAPRKPNYTGSLASYKESIANKPKGLDIPSPKDVVNYASSLVNKGRAAAGQTTLPSDKPLRTLGMGISMVNTAINPYAETTKKALGAAVNQDRQSVNQLITSAAKDVAITGAAVGVGVAASKGIEKVASAYKTAKTMSEPANIFVHGGPAKLEGGVINPKFVKGNTVLLNEQQLANPRMLDTLTKNTEFLKSQLSIPGSYAQKNSASTLAEITHLESKVKATQQWLGIAKKENYFTAVDDATSAYGHNGAYHVVKPKAQNVIRGFGPAEEVQIAGSQKPIKSFSTVDKTPLEKFEIAKEVNLFVDKLKQQQIRKNAITQVIKNIGKK